MLKRFIVFVIIGAFAWPFPSQAITMAERYLGRIVASTAAPETMYYVVPRTKERVRISSFDDIRSITSKYAIRITAADLARIPVAGTTDIGDVAYRRKMAGRFLRVVDRRNQAWYVHPRTKRRVRLGRSTTALNVVRAQRYLVSPETLAAIPTGTTVRLVVGDVVTSRGTFRTERLVFDWNDPAIRITTDTANASDCDNNCPTLSLGQFASRRRAIAALHGTYFCPQDYASCANSKNFYFAPIWNTYSSSWLNGDRIKFTTAPIMVFDTTNRPYLYRSADSFSGPGGLANRVAQDAQAVGGSGVIQAAMSNGPLLRLNGAHALDPNKLDTKQATVRGARGGIGWSGNTVMLFVAHGATVTDLAAVAAALKLDNAMNLDGGGSTAMMLKGSYILGPGRGLPNAILITRR